MREPNYFKEVWDKFKEWFLGKEHPHSKLNKNVFIHDGLKFTGFILIFLILYNNVGRLNHISFWIIQLGSVLLLINLFLVLRKAWHLIINLKYAYRGLNYGTKAIIAVVVVLLLLLVLLNQAKVVTSITEIYNEADFGKFNPVRVDTNFTLFDLSKNNSSGILNKVNTTPANRVRLVPSEMEEYGFWKDIYKSCASLETLGESQGVSDIKSKVCREACGKRNMEYSSKECDKDKLICYCSI
ncbi:MAG: hypothetical protein AABX83_03095 [Nanoarchaeota archaeon]